MTEDEYRKLSTEELKQCFLWIDDIQHPGRAKLLLHLIAERLGLTTDFVSLEDITADHTDYITVYVYGFCFEFEQQSSEGLAVREKIMRLSKL